MPCTGTCHSHINLVSRGKLLLIDLEKAKREEFNRRRKLRLQQVRQQSNDIAKEIRNKVREEKSLKFTQEELRKQAQFEKRKEYEIKTLQDEFNRQALISEQDKENALRELELEKLEKQRQQLLEDIAKKRGNLAVLKQRRDKLSDETENFIKSNNAKFNRGLENLRSALISTLPKPGDPKRIDSERSNVDRKYIDDRISRIKHGEDVTDERWEDSPETESVVRVIGGDDRSKGSQIRVESGAGSSTQSSCRFSAVSPERANRSESRISSPEKRHSSRVSLRKAHSECWEIPIGSSTSRSTQSGFASASDHSQMPSKTKPTVMSQVCGTKSRSLGSPNKRLPSNQLMSPSKRVAGSVPCDHSKSSSVRCNESYSPNKFRDELENSGRLRSRHVRFEDTPSLDGSDRLRSSLSRSRTWSEGDSELCYDSDVTWPPRDWKRHQDEEVLLYDHCGRTATTYQPKHTVNLINNQSGDEGLIDEVEACRERAIRKHEESLRERRGCRAMYRQRLRAEFSCMISDLAQLDKKTRLAKLDAEAKAALLPRKSKKPTDVAHENVNDKRGTYEENDNYMPGRVRVTDCTEPMDIDTEPLDTDTDLDDVKRPTNVEIVREEPSSSNLDALDLVIARLKEQRDYILSCEQPKEDSKRSDKIIQTSEESNAPVSVDAATSPQEVYTETEVQASSNSPVINDDSFVNRRGKSPRNSDSSMEEEPQPSATSPLNAKVLQDTPVVESEESKCKSKIAEKSPDKLSSEKSTPCDKKSPEQKVKSKEAKAISPIKCLDESSRVSFDANSYSFDGVKVEVKVTKNQDKKMQIITGISKKSSDSKESFRKETLREDSWAKKLAENSSSTGTSYMSPPNELNPDEHMLLISVLKGMEKKNQQDPVLRMYIQKLLSMSKDSLENMSISISDDSVRSDTYKTCVNVADSTKSKDGKYFITQQSFEEETIISAKPSTSKRSQMTKVILGSDESLSIKDLPSKQNDGKEKTDEDNNVNPQFIKTLDNCNSRLKQLTSLMKDLEKPKKKSSSANETSYLSIPSDLSGSVKLSKSIQERGLQRPEETLEKSEERDTSFDLCLPPDLALPANWHLRPNLLPRPEFESEKPVEKRPRPPTTINNYSAKNFALKTALPHELSTIAEADSRLLSSFYPNKHLQSTSTDQGRQTTKSTDEEKKSEEDSYHTLPSKGAVSSDSTLVSSGKASPIKPGDESSLQIFKEFPDSSFGQTSTEEQAISEVFRSIGIGWAVSTWRKTHEASRKVQESSSSSSPNDIASYSKKKQDEKRYRHSTPIKTSDAETNLKKLDCDVTRLTPPSITLYERYQDLIGSVSSSSTSTNS